MRVKYTVSYYLATLIFLFAALFGTCKKKTKSCEVPCKSCAPWENSCFLPPSLTVKEAGKRNLYHWTNPDTGFLVFRNRSYNVEYSPRSQFQAGSIAEEESVLYFIYFVLESLRRHDIKAESEEWSSVASDFILRNDEFSRVAELFSSDYRAIALKALENLDDSLKQNNWYIFQLYTDLMYEIAKDIPLSYVASPDETSTCAVIIDSRLDKHLHVSIKHTMNMLGPDWSLIVFHTEENEAFIRANLTMNSSTSSRVLFRRLAKLDWDQTSALRASRAFYSALPDSCQHILVFESDAVLRKKTDLADIVSQHHPVIAAPWIWCAEQWCRYGGNGGVTLRSKRDMLAINTEIRCESGACVTVDLYNESLHIVGKLFNTEDVFVARELFKHKILYEGRMPTFAQQQAFSVETMYYSDPIWVHKVWMYLHPIQAIELLGSVFSHYRKELRDYLFGYFHLSEHEKIASESHIDISGVGHL